MFCGKTADNLIETGHRRCLLAVLNDFECSYKDMLNKMNMKTFHQKNILVLMMEIYKSLNSLNLEFMQSMFSHKACPYKLRSGSLLILPRVKSSVGSNSVLFRGALAYNYLYKSAKESVSLITFKQKVSKHKVYCTIFRCTTL